MEAWNLTRRKYGRGIGGIRLPPHLGGGHGTCSQHPMPVAFDVGRVSARPAHRQRRRLLHWGVRLCRAAELAHMGPLRLALRHARLQSTTRQATPTWGAGAAAAVLQDALILVPQPLSTASLGRTEETKGYQGTCIDGVCGSRSWKKLTAVLGRATSG